MKTFDFEREEEIAAALVEAVKATRRRRACKRRSENGYLARPRTRHSCPTPAQPGRSPPNPRSPTRRLGPRD